MVISFASDSKNSLQSFDILKYLSAYFDIISLSSIEEGNTLIKLGENKIKIFLIISGLLSWIDMIFGLNLNDNFLNTTCFLGGFFFSYAS